MYGLGLIESALHSYVYPLRAIGVSVDEALDFEAWKYNGKGFNDFIRHIFNWRPSRCIILSGDVHYASAVASRVQSEDGSVAEILQFTIAARRIIQVLRAFGVLVMRSAIWLNARKRRGKKIRRHYNHASTIVKEERHTKCPATVEWQEELRYLPMPKREIRRNKKQYWTFIDWKGPRAKYPSSDERRSGEGNSFREG